MHHVGAAGGQPNGSGPSANRYTKERGHTEDSEGHSGEDRSPHPAVILLGNEAISSLALQLGFGLHMLAHGLAPMTSRP